MAASNYERVGKALDLLKAGLPRYLVRELPADYQRRSPDGSNHRYGIDRVGLLAETHNRLAGGLRAIRDRKGGSQEALAYNMLVKSWPELQKLAASTEGESARLL